MARAHPRYSHLSREANLGLGSVASLKKEVDIRNIASCNAYSARIPHIPDSLSFILPDAWLVYLYLGQVKTANCDLPAQGLSTSLLTSPALCFRIPVVQGQRWVGLTSDIGCIRPNSTMWTCHYEFAFLTTLQCLCVCRSAQPHVPLRIGKLFETERGDALIAGSANRVSPPLGPALAP